MFEICEELKELASLFVSDLYVVGGWVRDKLGGFERKGEADIDICSSIDPTEIQEVLKKNGFSLEEKSVKMGAYLITKNNQTFEYTRLRTEKYEAAHKHSPTDIEFVSSVKEDSLRRDFSINSIYYALNSGKLIDFHGGLQDIKNKIIRAVGSPEVVFSNDPVRILRMVRFACSLGFEVDKDTFTSAKKNTSNLERLSSGWKKREMQNIKESIKLYSHLTKGTNPTKRAEEMLRELDAVKYL